MNIGHFPIQRILFSSKLIALFLIAVLVQSCAQIKSPTGGDKDEEPPLAIGSDPANFATSFDSDRIQISFNEYIKVEGAREQLVISPPLENDPIIEIKRGRTVILQFDEELKDNTTYTINFGESIKDNNEGNILEENVFLFSTGTYIDSLQLRGALILAETDLPCASCLAMLYSDQSDSVIYDQKPYYVTRSDEQGQFNFIHLKGGNYKLVAIDDISRNMTYDRGEAIAFITGPVTVQDKDSAFYEMRLFTEQPAKLLMMGVVPDENKQSITLTFSKDVDDLNLRALNDSPEPLEELWFERRDSVEIWFSPHTTDEPIELEVMANDIILDTITVKTDRRSSDFSVLEVKRPSLSHTEAQVEVLFNRPIATVDLELCQLTLDSLEIPFELTKKSAKTWMLKSNWEEGFKYRFLFLPAAIKPLVGELNDSIGFGLECPKAEDLGTLLINVTDSAQSTLILTLKPEKGEQEFELAVDSSGQAQFNFLKPAKYSLTMLIDENGNGRWDTGDYLKGRQPEVILKHKELIQVKANWEVEMQFEPER